MKIGQLIKKLAEYDFDEDVVINVGNCCKEVYTVYPDGEENEGWVVISVKRY